MATTIKSTRVVKTFEYEGENYNIVGDYTTSESGNVVSVSGGIMQGDVNVGTFNAYDYTDNGDLKVNVSGVDIEHLVDIVAVCNDFVGEIKPKVQAEEPITQEPEEPAETPINEPQTEEEPDEITAEERNEDGGGDSEGEAETEGEIFE